VRIDSSAGALMSTLQAILFGMMLSWTPSVVLLAWLLWKEGIFEEENVRRSVHFDLERRNCFDASSPLIEGACALNMPDKPPASPPASFSAVAAAEVLPTSAPGDYHAPVVSITPA
jgi:hypothetical protein